MGGSGSFISYPATGTSMADSFAAVHDVLLDDGPLHPGWLHQGRDEQKNGVTADHYQASQAALAELGSAADVTAATWSADILDRTNGGYPVSMAIIGTAADKSTAYEILFDITNVNDRLT